MRSFRYPVIIQFILIGLFLTKLGFSQTWHQIHSGKRFGISGMALISHSDGRVELLIAHDNKVATEGKLAIITIEDERQIIYSPLIWPESIESPIDIEALTRIPSEEEFIFVALSSRGKAYVIKLNTEEKNISVIKTLTLPDIYPDVNFEGICIQEINGNLLAVWADRGKNMRPAKIYWGLFDQKNYRFSSRGSAYLKVPWPVKPDVRHIADIKIDSCGIVYITSVSDAGDNGPFESALYIAGVVSIHKKRVSFQQNNDLVIISKFEDHKIEAIDLMSGRTGKIICATDDENMGSFINYGQ